MQLLTATVTFTSGTAVVLSSLPAFAAIGRGAVAKLYIEPSAANTHVCYVGDNQLATGTSLVNHVIRVLAIPVAGDALDVYREELAQNQNGINLSDFSMDGTTSEQGRVTVFVD